VRYRKDIDGLRALAVVPVVLFHADIGPFTGGFVGVDVFFVISGYVISARLFEDLNSGHFSIIYFYERRVR
jgi:peptidoglycan/LPS O-acetylase OafA/YrhL